MSISVEYLEREEVFNYVYEYCKRNRIEFQVKREEKPYNTFNATRYEQERRINITFKSQWQQSCFLRIANQNYPYFEFQ